VPAQTTNEEKTVLTQPLQKVRSLVSGSDIRGSRFMAPPELDFPPNVGRAQHHDDVVVRQAMPARSSPLVGLFG